MAVSNAHWCIINLCYKNGIYSNMMFIACAPEMQRHAPFFARHFRAELFHFMLMALQHQTATMILLRSSKQTSRFHYQKNCLPVCTAHLTPNWQHELEWVQICFCRDVSQITVGVVEVYYRVPLYYLTVFAKKQTRIILGRGFIIIVLFYLFCKRSTRFVFTISCWKG